MISHTNLLFTLVPHINNTRNFRQNKILANKPDSFELQNNGGNKDGDDLKIRTFFTKSIDAATGTERLIPHHTAFITGLTQNFKIANSTELFLKTEPKK